MCAGIRATDRAALLENPQQVKPMALPDFRVRVVKCCRRLCAVVAGVGFGVGCSTGGGAPEGQSANVAEAVEARVWAFHRADTAKDAEAVISLLWPDFTMLVDGTRRDYAQVAAGSREFMRGLQLFHTEWSDLRVLPLGPDVAISSFQFRDSIVTAAGEVIRSRGPTTLVWERRSGEWRVRFADADHYPVEQ